MGPRAEVTGKNEPWAEGPHPAQRKGKVEGEKRKEKEDCGEDSSGRDTLATAQNIHGQESLRIKHTDLDSSVC